MMLTRYVWPFAVLAIVATGCEIRPRSDRTDLTSANTQAPVQTPAPTPPPPAATPEPAPAPKPVQTIVVQAPAKPAQTVFVQTPAPVDTVAVCRANFTRECTSICNAKVNKTTAPDKLRIAHDICFGECTRAANNRCH